MPGRKISRANMARIQQIADHAFSMGAKPPAADASPIGKADSLGDQIQAVARAVYALAGDQYGSCYVEDVYPDRVIIEVGEAYYQASYSADANGAVTLAARDAWVEVEEVWRPVTRSAKAGLMMGGVSQAHYATAKALGDRQIEVKVAYGGHKGGKDSHGEYFSARTDFDPENFPAPPLLYYHGYTEQNRKAARPVVTGKFLSRRAAQDGHYLTYQLKSGKYADLQWDAALKGECVVSPGTVGHLIRREPDGELTYWPLAEVSAWDFAKDRQPANLHSVAAPVLKALYLAEGLEVPHSLVNTPPEVAGDATSAGVDIDPQTAGRMIADVVASALLKGTT